MNLVNLRKSYYKIYFTFKILTVRHFRQYALCYFPLRLTGVHHVDFSIRQFLTILLHRISPPFLNRIRQYNHLNDQFKNATWRIPVSFFRHIFDGQTLTLFFVSKLLEDNTVMDYIFLLLNFDRRFQSFS